ncbi:oligosaccharide flippase family protein [Priestia flexa]|uniref:oligosaccharide flippase family protein n=1 Tax=Priestia flexa TaxID=86664 RepID=UPI002E1A7355|nr:oligosaccharide flippase family protein [Priestia flexa]MED3823622.1 oligosaccharide flippase family protein [Priestia flexa]
MSFKKFFNSKNKNVIDVLVLWTSQFATVGLAFFIQLILARVLDIKDYGSFTSALNIVTILGSIAAFGAGSNWLRAFGTEGWKAYGWIRPTIKINIVLFIGITSCLLISINYIHIADNTKLLIIMFISILLSLTFSTSAEAVYQLEEAYKKLAILKFLVQGFRFVVVVLALLISSNLFFIATGYTISSIILTCIYFFIIKRLYIGKVNLKGHKDNQLNVKVPDNKMKKTFKYLSPYGSTILFYSIYFQSNIFIIGVMLGEENVALYNVAFTILNVIYLFPTTFYQSYLIPKIHRWGENDKEKISLLFKDGSKVVIVLSVLIVVGIILCSPFIVPLLFGSKYQDSSMILILLAVTIPFRLLCNNLGSILVTEKHVVKKAYYQMIGAIISVILNISLINIWGLYGAAFATIITELIVMLLFVYGVNRYVSGVKRFSENELMQYSLLLFIITAMTFCCFYAIWSNYEYLISILISCILGLILIILILKILRRDLIPSIKKLLF